jgi:hypothetical protein
MQLSNSAVVEFLEAWRGRVQCVNIDAIGMGHYLRTALRGYVIQAINFGEEPKNRGKSWAVQCANRKAEMYWRTREILDAGGIKGLDDEMISQAAQVRFFYDLQGRIAIEPQITAAKRGISRRTGGSPSCLRLVLSRVSRSQSRWRSPGMGGRTANSRRSTSGMWNWSANAG